MTTDQSLNRLFSRRAWYRGTGINASTARIYKKRFLENKLELETRMRILRMSGFRIIQEMEWEETADDQQIRKELYLRLHRNNVFWSFDPESTLQIPDKILIEKVLTFLDVEDIQLLFRLFPRKEIKQVWKDKLVRQEPDLHALNRLYAFLFFDIKNPDRYIRSEKQKWYETWDERIN